MKEKDFNTIDEYIASQDKMFQKRLHELKQIILEASPLQIQEKISYRIPTFWRNGNIIHFAQHAKHIGLYLGPEAIKVYKEKLVNYKHPKELSRFQTITLSTKASFKNWCDLT